MKFAKVTFVVLLVSLTSTMLCAGVLDVSPDAPVVLKVASYILTFLSASIQSQTLAFVAWLVTLMVVVQSVLKAVSELLGLFADKTKTEVDNKLIVVFSKIVKVLGKVIGWFAVGSLPKSLK